MWCGVVWSGVVVWCGVVWCGVVWCGVVWCGVVWSGVERCGVAWCSLNSRSHPINLCYSRNSLRLCNASNIEDGVGWRQGVVVWLLPSATHPHGRQ